MSRPGSAHTRRVGRAVLAAVASVIALALPGGASALAAPDSPAEFAGVHQARPPIAVATLRTPPRTAAPASRFRVKGTLRNLGRGTRNALVQVSLRRTKGATPTAIGAKRYRVRGRRSFDVRVTVPRRLSRGSYYLRVCARDGSRTSLAEPTAACRWARRKLTVRTPVASPPPARPGTPAPLPAPVTPNAPRFDVLVFTGDQPASAYADGVDALTDLARRHHFNVSQTGDPATFTAARLSRYRAVVLLGNVGSPLDTAQEAAFEAYYKDGGGLVAIGSAIEAEPGWAYLSTLLGTRAAGTSVPAADATIKVADRVHEASRSLPEYWRRSDRFYNFKDNVRGLAHVLATVDETTYTGGTMKALADHPVAWCKDYQGGRSFYTNAGANGVFEGDDIRAHLLGAVEWAAGVADPVYSDCGATVLANYQQVKVSANPNLNEPIGFDTLPDGRVIQTARGGEVRLHDPNGGSSTIIATIPVYTNGEDGLYGPAIDNDFASDKWVYLYYSPPTVTNVEQSDGTTRTITTPPNSGAPTTAPDLSAWDPYVGYFQLSRFKFVDGAGADPPRLDLASEQKILRVSNNRGACCHVAGDIDFDQHNNLWLVTGDDTPSGGGNSGGFSPFNDMKTDETQTVRPSGAFTLSFDGQTTATLPADATPGAIQAALEALPNVDTGDVIVTGTTVGFDGRYAQKNVPQMTATGATVTTTQEGDWFQAPYADARRTAGNTNDLRGKVLRIKVNADGTYRSPAGNLFPEAQDAEDRTRPEIYAMGFRNPFRIQVDRHDVAYVTDYSPDSSTPENFRGPAGTGRVEVVRHPANYGWPLCVAPNLPYYRWNFNTSAPLDPSPSAYECDNPDRGPQNRSRWNTGESRDPATEPGRVNVPPITQPDLWYSYRDNANPPLGTPCLASYDGSNGTCPQRFPELYTTGVAPHGAAPYDYDAHNPNPTKFPPYYDGAFVLGEFNADTLREVRVDQQKRIFKINQFLDCGAALAPSSPFPFECDNPMDMQFGSDGNYYLLTYGDGFYQANPDAGMYRWEYVKGQRAPRAAMNATPTTGVAPLTVRFSSDGSRDPDPGDSIRFAWDFDGDGTVDSTDPNPSHTYTTNGIQVAKLTVTDSAGKSDTKTLSITVGNTAPTITIDTPLDGDFFQWGEKIPFTVTATDPEDGPIDCSRVTVTFVLVHDTHGHAEEAKTGCSGTLQTNAEDASHGGYIAGGISATYTDRGANGLPALSATAQHVIQLRRQQVEYAQEQEGTVTTASGEPDPGGGQVRAGIDPDDSIALNNRVNLAHMDKQITLRFSGPDGFPPFVPLTPAGTDLVDVEVRDGSPTGPLLTTVRLKATGSTAVYQSFSAPLNYAGSKHLHLVFRQIPGGPVIPYFGYGNLNWVSFSGTGAGITP